VIQSTPNGTTGSVKREVYDNPPSHSARASLACRNGRTVRSDLTTRVARQRARVSASVLEPVGMHPFRAQQNLHGPFIGAAFSNAIELIACKVYGGFQCSRPTSPEATWVNPQSLA